MGFREWNMVKLSDIVDVLGDGLHGTPKYDSDGEYYFINGNNLNERILINEDTKKVSYEEYVKYKKELNDRTVLISINGTLGKVALYNGEKVVLGKSACYFNVKNNADKHFVKYVMLNNHFKTYMNSHSTGTTIKNMGLKALREYSFSLPPLEEQTAISQILSTLDEKIEVNNHINKTLESMAQKIFKRWFVDFEFPNENGDPYKSSGGEMVESEIGMIPQGWEVVSFGQMVKTNAKTYSEKEKWGYVNYFDTGSITRNVIGEYQKIDLTVEKLPSRAKRKVVYNDIVFSTVRPNQLHYGFIKEPLDNMLVSTGFAVLTSTDMLASEYFYLWLTQDRVIEYLQSIAETSTSTFPAIKPSDIEAIKIVKPTNQINQLIETFFKRCFDQSHQKNKENIKLAELRDTLLPKLMSGEIHVPIIDSELS